MKGVRFYQDENGCGIKMRGWKKLFPKGFNGLAVFHEQTFWSNNAFMVEARGAVLAGAGDGPYCGTSAQYEYIQKNCRRISEKEARELFPNLVAEIED